MLPAEFSAPLLCPAGTFGNSTYLKQCAQWDAATTGIRDTLIGFGLVTFASAGICIALNLQKLVHVRMSHDYRHTDLPSGGSNEYVFIRTSQGKDYQLHKSSGFQRL